MKYFTKVFVALVSLSLFCLLPAGAQTFLTEDFSTAVPPAGWTIDAYSGNWSQESDNQAGGTIPEAEFSWTPSFTGTSRLISPTINTSGLSVVILDFSHYLDDYSGYSGEMIGVATRSGAGAWNTEWSYLCSSDLGPELKSLSISNTDVGATDFQFCFFFTGYSLNIDYWYIDDVTLYAPLPDDAGISAILTPTSPVPLTPVMVNVQVENFGVNNITSTLVRWTVNGTAQTPQAFVGNLAPGGTSSLSLGAVTLPAGQHTITAWTNFPNGTADPDQSNDTSSVTLIACNPLSGVYTVGSSISADFDSLQAALDAITTCGIAGPVTFNIESGIDTNQYTFVEVPGASATNTITIQSATGNAADVEIVYAPTGFSDNWTILFDGADYFILQNLSISTDANNTASYGRVISLENGANNNVIDNCVLNGKETPGSTNSNYSVIDSDGADFGDNNTFSNNTILNGSYGFYLAGTSSNLMDGNMVINNTITGFSGWGVLISYSKNSTVAGNTITSSTNTASTVYGLRLYNSDSAHEAYDNEIYVTGSTTAYGIDMWYLEGGSGKEINIYNNSITVDGGTSLLYGIREYQGKFHNIYNNSVLINSGDGLSEYAYYVTGSDDINVINNCFANMTGGYAAYATSSPLILSIDYNNYYTTGTDLGYYNGTTFENIADWQAATSVDLNSVSYNPFYTSVTDLTPQSTPLDNQGTPLTMVPNDITGAARHATTPDIGAYEFVGTSSTLELDIPGGVVCDNVQLVVPINVQNMSDVAAISLALNVDSGFTFNSVQNIAASLSGANFLVNATADQVKISWLNTTGTGVNIPDGAICELVFDAVISGEYAFTWDLGPNGCEIVDGSANAKDVSYAGVDADISSCSNINGNLAYNNVSIPNTNLAGIGVDLTDGSKAIVASATTTASGDFSFTDVPNGAYELSFTNSKPWSGTNSVDALLALQHAVSMITLTGMQFQVGEVAITTPTPAINATDALRIQKRFVGQAASFDIDDWQYSAMPFTLETDTNMYLLAGCAGDINGSYAPAKVQPQVYLGQKGTMYVEEGQDVSIPFFASTDIEIGAAALELRIPAGIEVLNLDINSVDGEFLWNQQGNTLMISWCGLTPMRLSEGENMFTLEAKIRNKQVNNFAFGGQSQMANAQAVVYTDAGLYMPKLSTEALVQDLMISNYPNPFNTSTTITFYVPEDGKTSLRLFDVTGAEVASLLNEHKTAGEYSIEMARKNLVEGVYFYTLTQGNQSVSGRMLISK